MQTHFEEGVFSLDDKKGRLPEQQSAFFLYFSFFFNMSTIVALLTFPASSVAVTVRIFLCFCFGTDTLNVPFASAIAVPISTMPIITVTVASASVVPVTNMSL